MESLPTKSEKIYNKDLFWRALEDTNDVDSITEIRKLLESRILVINDKVEFLIKINELVPNSVTDELVALKVAGAYITNNYNKIADENYIAS